MDHVAFLLFTLSCSFLSFCFAIPGPIDLLQAARDQTKYKQIKGYFRIDVELIEMKNPRGTTWNYMPCDLVPGWCDPKISAAIDYETPNNDFGKDSVPYGNYIQLLSEKRMANVPIGRTISKDICGGDTRKVNVRVLALDTDLLRDDVIDHFSCFITTDDPPADDEASAKMSAEKTCDGHNGSHKIIWRYRWYAIPQDQCKVTPGSSGIIRRNIPIFGRK